MMNRLPGAAVLPVALGFAALVGLGLPSANAQIAGSSLFSAPAAAAPEYSTTYSPERRYFVEFRARNAESYGHMYVMYGEVNDRHEIIKSEVAGFFPSGDTQKCEDCGVTNWTVGHVLPVPSEIGASDGDLEEMYVLARFRIWIDHQHYQRLVAYINERKATKGPWNAFLANCVTFGRDVANFLHVKMPFYIALTPSVVMYPKTLVEAIRNENGVYQDQGPLKDAGGSLPPELAAQLGGGQRSATAEAGSRHPKKKMAASKQDLQKTAASAIH